MELHGQSWRHDLPTGTASAIVAHVNSAATLWDYGIESIGIFGPLKREDGSREPLTESIDLDAVTALGADLDVPAVTAARERDETAAESVGSRSA